VAWKYWKISDPISPDMVCAREGTKSSCKGDSGGPLIVKGTNAAQDVQVGIVSWGWPCDCTEDLPAVYCRVAFDSDWIASNIAEWTSVARESIA